jgi:hypothetical protein
MANSFFELLDDLQRHDGLEVGDRIAWSGDASGDAVIDLVAGDLRRAAGTETAAGVGAGGWFGAVGDVRCAGASLHNR